jgi:hypothetical protein
MRRLGGSASKFEVINGNARAAAPAAFKNVRREDRLSGLIVGLF